MEAQAQQDYLQSISQSITSITDQVLKQAMTSTETKLEQMVEVTAKELDKLREGINNIPTRHVSINNSEPVKVKGQVVPHLGRMIINAKLGLNSLLVGPAGCGKTISAQQLAEAMELQFGSVCLTAGASETWLFGRQTPNGFVEGPFSKLYKEGGVFLADEMDAADANLLLSINTALANGIMFNPMNGEHITKHEDFVFVGAANTFGKGADHVYTGRSRLDGATLDRFVVLEIDYDKEYEKIACPDNDLREFLDLIRRDLKEAGCSEFISTRWYDYSFKMKTAGIELEDIKNSLIANWGNEAKRVVGIITTNIMNNE